MTGTLRHRMPLDLLRAVLEELRARREGRGRNPEYVAHEAGVGLGRLLLAGAIIAAFYLLGTMAAWWSF